MQCPFTIVIDTAEQFAFDFRGMKADADKNFQLIDVPVVRQCLGRHPESFGDYSIRGAEQSVAIERKSIEDLHSTLLGFSDGHRARFESELANLSKIKSLVVVEGSLHAVLLAAPEYGTRTAAENAKSIFRSIIALQQDHKVPWMFCDTRDLARHTAFRFLWRYWEKNMKPVRRRKKEESASVVDLLSNV